MKPNGYILSQDQWRVIIATGFSRPSKNTATTGMRQIWTLPAQMDPVEAYHQGHDHVTCNLCPLRHSLGGDCYVKLWRAPLTIWQAWKRGIYPVLPGLEVFNGHSTRFGAYGEPTFLSLPFLRSIAEASIGWTGYTHQWRNPLFQGYKSYLMASVDSIEEQFHARKMGWRTFRVDSTEGEGKPWKLSDEVHCPKSKEMGHLTDCAHCQLCQGSSKSAKSVVIRKH